MHVTMGQGTNFEVKIPWRVETAGYTSNISGTLMMAEATTSLAYRDMLKCETLQIQVIMITYFVYNTPVADTPLVNCKILKIKVE